MGRFAFSENCFILILDFKPLNCYTEYTEMRDKENVMTKKVVSTEIKFDLIRDAVHLNSTQLVEFKEESKRLQEMASVWDFPKQTDDGRFKDADDWLNYKLWELLEDFERQSLMKRRITPHKGGRIHKHRFAANHHEEERFQRLQVLCKLNQADTVHFATFVLDAMSGDERREWLKLYKDVMKGE